jgi:hypothetical protein
MLPNVPADTPAFASAQVATFWQRIGPLSAVLSESWWLRDRLRLYDSIQRALDP